MLRTGSSSFLAASSSQIHLPRKHASSSTNSLLNIHSPYFSASRLSHSSPKSSPTQASSSSSSSSKPVSTREGNTTPSLKPFSPEFSSTPNYATKNENDESSSSLSTYARQYAQVQSPSRPPTRFTPLTTDQIPQFTASVTTFLSSSTLKLPSTLHISSEHIQQLVSFQLIGFQDDKFTRPDSTTATASGASSELYGLACMLCCCLNTTSSASHSSPFTSSDALDLSQARVLPSLPALSLSSFDMVLNGGFTSNEASLTAFKKTEFGQAAGLFLWNFKPIRENKSGKVKTSLNAETRAGSSPFVLQNITIGLFLSLYLSHVPRFTTSSSSSLPNDATSSTIAVTRQILRFIAARDPTFATNPSMRLLWGDIAAHVGDVELLLSWLDTVLGPSIANNILFPSFSTTFSFATISGLREVPQLNIAETKGIVDVESVRAAVFALRCAKQTSLLRTFYSYFQGLVSSSVLSEGIMNANNHSLRIICAEIGASLLALGDVDTGLSIALDLFSQTAAQSALRETSAKVLEVYINSQRDLFLAYSQGCSGAANVFDGISPGGSVVNSIEVFHQNVHFFEESERKERNSTLLRIELESGIESESVPATAVTMTHANEVNVLRKEIVAIQRVLLGHSSKNRASQNLSPPCFPRAVFVLLQLLRGAASYRITHTSLSLASSVDCLIASGLIDIAHVVIADTLNASIEEKCHQKPEGKYDNINSASTVAFLRAMTQPLENTAAIIGSDVVTRIRKKTRKQKGEDIEKIFIYESPETLEADIEEEKKRVNEERDVVDEIYDFDDIDEGLLEKRNYDEKKAETETDPIDNFDPDSLYALLRARKNVKDNNQSKERNENNERLATSSKGKKKVKHVQSADITPVTSLLPPEPFSFSVPDPDSTSTSSGRWYFSRACARAVRMLPVSAYSSPTVPKPITSEGVTNFSANARAYAASNFARDKQLTSSAPAMLPLFLTRGISMTQRQRRKEMGVFADAWLSFVSGLSYWNSPTSTLTKEEKNRLILGAEWKNESYVLLRDYFCSSAPCDVPPSCLFYSASASSLVSETTNSNLGKLVETYTSKLTVVSPPLVSLSLSSLSAFLAVSTNFDGFNEVVEKKETEINVAFLQEVLGLQTKAVFRLHEWSAEVPGLSQVILSRISSSGLCSLPYNNLKPLTKQPKKAVHLPSLYTADDEIDKAASALEIANSRNGLPTFSLTSTAKTIRENLLEIDITTIESEKRVPNVGAFRRDFTFPLHNLLFKNIPEAFRSAFDSPSSSISIPSTVHLSTVEDESVSRIMRQAKASSQLEQVVRLYTQLFQSLSCIEALQAIEARNSAIIIASSIRSSILLRFGESIRVVELLHQPTISYHVPLLLIQASLQQTSLFRAMAKPLDGSKPAVAKRSLEMASYLNIALATLARSPTFSNKSRRLVASTLLSIYASIYSSNSPTPSKRMVCTILDALLAMEAYESATLLGLFEVQKDHRASALDVWSDSELLTAHRASILERGGSAKEVEKDGLSSRRYVSLATHVTRRMSQQGRPDAVMMFLRRAFDQGLLHKTGSQFNLYGVFHALEGLPNRVVGDVLTEAYQKIQAAFIAEKKEKAARVDGRSSVVIKEVLPIIFINNMLKALDTAGAFQEVLELFFYVADPNQFKKLHAAASLAARTRGLHETFPPISSAVAVEEKGKNHLLTSFVYPALAFPANAKLNIGPRTVLFDAVINPASSALAADYVPSRFISHFISTFGEKEIQPVSDITLSILLSALGNCAEDTSPLARVIMAAFFGSEAADKIIVPRLSQPSGANYSTISTSFMGIMVMAPGGRPIVSSPPFSFVLPNFSSSVKLDITSAKIIQLSLLRVLDSLGPFRKSRAYDVNKVRLAGLLQRVVEQNSPTLSGTGDFNLDCNIWPELPHEYKLYEKQFQEIFAFENHKSPFWIAY